MNNGLVMTWRNLKRVPRIPELAIFAILQSIMFVLLFAYVFGGAIPLPGGGSYREYLMPGIYIQTLGFASVTTAIAVTDDMAKGLIDRFRSLPMARSAVLSGRTVSDVIYNTGILLVLMLTGLAVGWRVHTNVGDFLLAAGLMLFFTFAMAWIGVLAGLLVASVEVALQLGFLIMFPLTRTPSSRPRRCPAGCGPWRSGTRSALSRPRRASSSATRTRSRPATRATIRSCSRSSGRSRCSPSSLRSRCGSTARSTARRPTRPGRSSGAPFGPVGPAGGASRARRPRSRRARA